MSKAGYEENIPEKVKLENEEKLAKYKAEIQDGEKQREVLSKLAWSNLTKYWLYMILPPRHMQDPAQVPEVSP